jgi:hypothetical protein
MDGEKFDDLIRKICTTRLTRVGALRGMVAGAAAALTGATLAFEETAGKGKKGAAKKGGAKNGGAKQGKGKKGARRGQDGRVRSQEVSTCSTTTPTPTPESGNPDECKDDRVDNPTLGTGQVFHHQDSNCECWLGYDITEADGNQGKKLAFYPLADKTPCLVGKVIVKAGSGDSAALVYSYSPKVSCDSGLHGQDNKGISHFDFCGVECPECDPEICPADKVIGHDEKCTFDDGCDSTFDCPCDTSCEDKTTGNYECKGGTCTCKPEECASGTKIPRGDACTFSDGCCGDYECPCDTSCPNGTTSNNTCKDGKCVCKPQECQTPGYAGDPCGAFDDHCCGTYPCNCKQACPSTATPAKDVTKYTNENTCTDGTCVCTPTDKKAACAGNCGQTVDDGCCGTYTCPACCNSCTQGYYKQNQCTQNGSYSWGGGARPSDALTTICPGGSTIQAYCISKGYTTIGKALTAKGNDVICAQFAAAYLNQRLTRGQYEDCTTLGIGNICALPNSSESNATLSFWNEGGEQGYEICPNKGCGS